MDSKDVLKRLNDIASLELIEQEEELKKIAKESDFKITQLRNQLNDIKSIRIKKEKDLEKIKQEEEKERKKVEREEERERKKIEKEEKKEEYDIDKEIIKKEKLESSRKTLEEKERIKKEKAEIKEEKEIQAQASKLQGQMSLEEININYKKCSLSFFHTAFDMDFFKKATDAYAKRIVANNDIITFKDNKAIFIYSKEDGIYEESGDVILSEVIQKELEEHTTDNAVKEIINKIRRKTYVSREILQKQPKKYQPVGNGLLDLETGELKEFTPKYIFFTKININFNKDAKCDTFIKFLESSLEGNKQSIAIVQEWIGNLLLNDNRFQRALLLYGSKGENGKSVLLKVIGKFLGHKNFCSISLQALEKNQFALARLATKRANMFFDLPKAALSQTSNFKLITSGDPVTGEYKGQDSFEFYPMTKMMFSCNEVPRTPDRTAAFFRRWIVIQFNKTFPEGHKDRIENLDEILSTKEELEGMLQFAYQGLQRLKQNKKFTQNMDQLELREFWIKKSDSVASFAMDTIEPSRDGAWIEKWKIYGMYQTYCEVQGYEPITENVFFKALKDFMSLDEYRPSKIDDHGNVIRVTALKVKLKDKEEQSEL